MASLVNEESWLPILTVELMLNSSRVLLKEQEAGCNNIVRKAGTPKERLAPLRLSIYTRPIWHTVCV